MGNGRSKTCFVISPIGPEGSDVRQHADDLLELAIEPALQTFGFTVVRADRIARPSLITNDVIQLVQEAELCVADLTHRNPNVFYEVGRRHETGKPIIQVIRKDEDIPFDLAGVRTIKFDLSEPRTVHRFVLEIRSFVEAFEKSEYALPASGISLASIAQSIERLERSVARLNAGAATTVSTPTSVPVGDSAMVQILGDPRLRNLLGPAQLIESLIQVGDIEQATSTLVRAQPRLPAAKFYELAAYLAMAGSETGATLALEGLEKMTDEPTIQRDRLLISLGSVVQYYVNRDEESLAITRLGPVMNRLIKKVENSKKDHAFVLNQIAKLYTGAGDIDSAIAYTLQATELDPEEEAYQRNLVQLRERLARTRRGGDEEE